MKKLIEQMIKFGLVGALSFVIDFVITMTVAWGLRKGGIGTDIAALVGAFFGFVISVIVNYLLSMKFVFVRKEDMNRKKEFVIFVSLSVVGLAINEIIIMLALMISKEFANSLYNNHPDVITAGAKIFATAVVMVYNFVTRKIFLESKDANGEK